MTEITQKITDYNNALLNTDSAITNLLATIINNNLPNATNKIWHGHPVWFIDGNPIVGYSKVKDSIRLLFWSGQSFDDEVLVNTGNYKAAQIDYTDINQVIEDDLKRLIAKSIDIQWDYKNIVKRKGELLKLK